MSPFPCSRPLRMNSRSEDLIDGLEVSDGRLCPKTWFFQISTPQANKGGRLQNEIYLLDPNHLLRPAHKVRSGICIHVSRSHESPGLMKEGDGERDYNSVAAANQDSFFFTLCHSSFTAMVTSQPANEL